MGKKLAIEHHLIRPNEVIELLEMMGGKNKDNADGCSFLYYTLCTPKINNPNNDKVICGFTNLKMQNDFFAIFTLEKFWKKYPYKLNDLVLCNDGLLGVVTKMEWDCEKRDMKYYISFNPPVSYDIPVVDNKWYSSKNIKCKFMEAKNKKLAIKGHQTRGKEVIELLEMMGGKNTYGHNGEMESLYFFINNDNIIHDTSFFNDNYVFFTLEEFLEKYPFKVNDRVIDEADGCPGVVCEIKWDEDVSDMKYCVAFGNGIDFGWFANNSINFFKIKKNENLEENKFPPFEPMFKMNDELEYMVPDGYEITEASKDKVFIKPIKSKYPKTLGDCCKVIVDIGDYQMCGYKHELLFNFQNLLICCGAYWKIAGEEMGLGKPWEPDWDNLSTNHEFIKINKGCFTYSSRLLVFPTKEMRDVFSENFKDLIEQCKELL